MVCWGELDEASPGAWENWEGVQSASRASARWWGGGESFFWCLVEVVLGFCCWGDVVLPY